MAFSPPTSISTPRSPLLLLLVFNSVLLPSIISTSSQNGAVSAYAQAEDDAAVLLRFKDSVTDPSGLLSGWNQRNSGGHCSWFGVFCNEDFQVVSLNITGDGGGKDNSNPSPFSSCLSFDRFSLYGIGIRKRWSCLGKGMGASGGRLVGKLPSVIGELTQLRVLSFPFNDFDGEIPSEIWGMLNLEVLDLEGNSITGQLPFLHLNLNMRTLNLGFNSIHGEIPTSLSNFVSLEILNLAGNRLNGSVPGFIGRLKEVHLSYNLLTGNVPSEVGDNCWNLEHLDLSGNFLVKKIPSSLGNCSRLKTLLLYSNMLEEGIPSELGRLQALQVLDVSGNSLVSVLPRELGSCSELSVLVLSSLFDPLLQGNLTTLNDSLLKQSQRFMTDDLNYYQGTIPVEITTLPKLRVLWAPTARFEGSLPSNWGDCESLELVNLAQNFLTGEIPTGLSRCSKLRFLDISSNNLTGELVQDFQVPCMTMFDVSKNMFSGSIPEYFSSTCSPDSSWDDYSFKSEDPPSSYQAFFASKAQAVYPLKLHGEDEGLVVFHNFGQNNFTGTLQSFPIAPERLGNKTRYAFLVGENKFTRAFPSNFFEKCNGLDSLIVNVSHNKIYGQIPAQIGVLCRSLVFLDASGNKLFGSIPSTFGELVSLVGLDLSRNMLQGPIPTSLGLIKDLKYLFLSGNDLTDIIPSSLGQLYSLKVLDLSSNSLTGEIPNDLVNLQNLTVLQLQRNSLSGQIPSGFADVSTLSDFNVSFNNLSGSMPLNSAMNCNTALGNPFIYSCHVSSSAQPVSSSQSSTALPAVTTQKEGSRGISSTKIAYIASASTIISVLLALVCLFLFTRNWNLKSEAVGFTRKEVTVFASIGFPLTFESVLQATGNFSASKCIGNGGFGATYKAEISPGILVAVKRLSVGRFQGVQQFHAEIKTLGRLRHPNLVTLLGYHASETEMFLIYNYFPGGNLEKFIQERSLKAVNWKTLHKIALDVGRALAFLHGQCAPRVLHRDVKPSNILLDDDHNAYLSDFGLSRLLGTSETHATTGVAGTFGYVAPEYAMTCRVSDKADVYSYGVMLMELLSYKKALDPSFSTYGNGFNIVSWANMLIQQDRAKDFFIPGLWDAGPHGHLIEVLHLACKCTVVSLSMRPTMKQVVQQLKLLQPPSC